MTDIEIVKACALAMGLSESWHPIAPVKGPAIWISPGRFYDPLHDDAQAMALVRRFEPWITPKWLSDQGWLVTIRPSRKFSDQGIPWADAQKFAAVSKDLNRAICECVAKLPPSPEHDKPT